LLQKAEDGRTPDKSLNILLNPGRVNFHYLIHYGFIGAMLMLLSGLGCFTFYDLIIKRVRFLRPLFGLKRR